MRKEEFLEQLEMLLADISAEERAEAMAFYRSYFEDAGMGNEEKILAELESPEKVAEIIKRDLGMVCTTGTKTDDAQSAQNTGYQNYTQNTYGTYANSEEAKRENERKNNTILVLVIVLGILTSPAYNLWTLRCTYRNHFCDVCRRNRSCWCRSYDACECFSTCRNCIYRSRSFCVGDSSTAVISRH